MSQMWDELTYETIERELMILAYNLETAAMELMLIGFGFVLGMWYLSQIGRK